MKKTKKPEILIYEDVKGSLVRIGRIIGFMSFIATERYQSPGDFQLEVPADDEVVGLIQTGRFLAWYVGAHMTEPVFAVIERIEISDTEDSGMTLLASGRTITAQLGQRIIQNPRTYSGSRAENIIRNIINNEVLLEGYRNLPLWSLASSNNWTETAYMQTEPDNVLDKITEICAAYDWGYRAKAVADQSGGYTFKFELYKGEDRTPYQDDRPKVTFSREFKNLISVTYGEDISDYKTYTYIAGEGETWRSRKKTSFGGGSYGLRREIYTDAGGISQTDEAGAPIPDANYIEMLEAAGRETIAENQKVQFLSVEVSTTGVYVINEDCFLGDLVYIQAGFGINAVARITEITESWDTNGYAIYPTLEVRTVEPLLTESGVNILTESDEDIYSE